MQLRWVSATGRQATQASGSAAAAELRRVESGRSAQPRALGLIALPGALHPQLRMSLQAHLQQEARVGRPHRPA